MSPDQEPLESGRIAEISASKARYEDLLQFHWEYYSELAFQRERIYDSLKESLSERGTPFEFSKWQRAVKYKYSLDPLSVKGSVSDPGGRFNIGAIDSTRYPIFAALYVASDKGTALAELLGRDNAEDSLTAEEMALTRPDSVAALSVSGRLESTIDIREGNNLAGFVNLIRDFTLSKSLHARARRLGIHSPRLIRTVGQLADELRNPNWRLWPMQLDVPASSQIFGRAVLDAGIEGILYTSVLTQRPCLAVYPQNFSNSTSYVELDDPAPAECIRRRVDALTFADFL